MSTKTRQVVDPNINISSQPGWCLKYVDDGVNAPLRQARAIDSYRIENDNGNIRTGNLPTDVRVPGFLGFHKGAYTQYGHVFWIIQNDDGSVRIDDSEVHSGARGVYHSIAELLAWFGAYEPYYLGYSLWIDGVQIAEEYDDPDPTPVPDNGGSDNNSSEFAVGDTVAPNGNISDYDGTPLKQWDDQYTITELIGDRAVLEARDQVWAAVRTSDIHKLG